MNVSMLIVGGQTTVQHQHASYMIYRLCITASSVSELYERHQRAPFGTLDHGSIGVLCRTMWDASLMYWYLTEDLSDNEWEFRSLVLMVHDAASRVRLFKSLGPEDAEKQRGILRDLKEQLLRNEIFQARRGEDQQKLLSGQSIYVNGMRSLLPSMNIEKVYFDGLYNYLSAQVHLSPLAYFRARPDTPMEIIHSRNFMGLCLLETAKIVARVGLREVELSGLEERINTDLFAQMKEFARPSMGALD